MRPIKPLKKEDNMTGIFWTEVDWTCNEIIDLFFLELKKKNPSYWMQFWYILDEFELIVLIGRLTGMIYLLLIATEWSTMNVL